MRQELTNALLVQLRTKIDIVFLRRYIPPPMNRTHRCRGLVAYADGVTHVLAVRQFSGANRDLCGRLCDSQSRKSEGGIGVDAWGAGATGIDSQREEDECPERSSGAFRFSGIQCAAEVHG
jgi:hypothetical protein